MALFRTVLTVLLVIIALLYAAFFVSWNAANVVVVGLDAPYPTKMVEDLPLWSLPFIGGVAGVFAMLFSMWTLWAGQKRQTDKFKRQVARAKQIIADRNGAIEKHEQRIADLEGQVAAQEAAAEAAREAADAAPTDEPPTDPPLQAGTDEPLPVPPDEPDEEVI